MSHKTVISTNDLAIGYKKKPTLKELNLSIEESSFICLLGVNGIGKSTLIKSLSGLIPILNGDIKYRDKNLHLLSKEELARKISIVLNNQGVNQQLSVQELISLGRSPFTSWLGRIKKEDLQKINHAANICGIEHLKNKTLGQISDGERQRAMIARCLAQDTEVLFLDEAMAFLDYPSKYQLIKLLKSLTKEQKKSILLSTHDWELALQIADKIWFIEESNILIVRPDEINQQERFQKIFKRYGFYFD